MRIKLSQVIFFLFFILSGIASWAQEENLEFISSRNVLGSRTYFKNNQPISLKEIQNLVADNDQALKLIKSARANYNTAIGLSYVGGFLIGWELGNMITGSQVNNAVLLSGLGLLIISTPFQVKYNSRSKRAVELYNENLTNDPELNKMEMSFYSTGAGLGFRLSF